MIQYFHKSMEKREDGFTLIELLVVMIIIGILAAIAIPIFLSQRNKGYDKAAQSDLRNLAAQQEVYADDHQGAYAAPPLAVGNADAITLLLPGWHMSSGVKTVAITGDQTTWCADAVANSDNPFHYLSSDGSVQAGPCA